MTQGYTNGVPHVDQTSPYDANETYDGYHDADNAVDYLQRPLSELTGIPYRGSGVTGHAVDTDTLLKDYVAPGATELPWDGDGKIEELPLHLPIVTVPVDVRLVDDVTTRKTQRVTNVRQLFGVTEVYYSGVGVPDTLRMGDNAIFPADDERDSVIISVVAGQAGVTGVNGALYYGFAISSDSSFGSYVALYETGRSVTIKGTNAIYAAIIPLKPYDGLKDNFFALNAVAEYTRAL